MSSNWMSGSFATKSLRSARRPLSASSTAHPEANTPTSIEFVPVDQSVSSFWKRSANGTDDTLIVAPVIALNSSPRSSRRPAMTGPGRVRMLTVTPSCFISAPARGANAAAPRAAAPMAAAARVRWVANISFLRSMDGRPARIHAGSPPRNRGGYPK